MIGRSVFFVVMFGGSHPDEQRRKHREDVRLDRSHEQLEQVDKQREAHTHRRYQVAGAGTKNLGKGKNEADEAQDNEVPGRHIRKKSDRQCERLGKEAEDLNRKQNRSDEPGHPGADDVLPVIPRRAELSNEEGEQRQYGGDHQIRSGGGAKGNEPEKVCRKDEEKDGQQVGQEPFVLRTDRGLCDLVPDEDDEQLEQVLEQSTWCGLAPDPTFVAACKRKEYREDDQRRQDRKNQMPRDGKIDQD